MLDIWPKHRLNLPEPQFCHLQNEHDNSTQLRNYCVDLDEVAYMKFLNGWPHLTSSSFDRDYSSVCLSDISSWISNLACLPHPCSSGLSCLNSGSSILSVFLVRNLGVVLQATFPLLYPTASSVSSAFKMYL